MSFANASRMARDNYKITMDSYSTPAVNASMLLTSMFHFKEFQPSTKISVRIFNRQIGTSKNLTRKEKGKKKKKGLCIINFNF